MNDTKEQDSNNRNPHVVDYADKASWLEARRQGIGASDAAVILGLSPWKTPFQLYLEKLGVNLAETEQTEAMTWGLRLQPIIIDAYAEQTGRIAIAEKEFRIDHSPFHPWMFASLDGWVQLPRTEYVPEDVGVLEVKTTTQFRKHDWEDAPPLIYQVQLQHQLAVTGAAWGTLVCLIGGQRLVWADMQRNDEFITQLIVKEQAFWSALVEKNPPAADASRVTTDALGLLYPKEQPGKTVCLLNDALEWDAIRQEAIQTIKDAEEKKRLAENSLKTALGDAETGMLSTGVSYSWKTVEKSGYTVSPTTTRVLRRKDATI